MPTDPYGLSKNVINRIIEHETNFYNIRVYGVFDENELDTRFIKSNIKRYITNQPLEIHQNKLMDFIYMEDLISLVKYYIENTDVNKITEGCYVKKYSLIDIANIINNLSNYKVSINVHNEGIALPYIGKTTPPIEFIGLEKGIKNVYNELK